MKNILKRLLIFATLNVAAPSVQHFITFIGK